MMALTLSPLELWSFDLTRGFGQRTVVLVGNVSPKVELPLQKIVTRQIRMQGSCAISGEYPAVIKLMASGKLAVEDLISKTAPLSEGQIWFDKLYNREDNLLKVVLLP